MINKAHTFKSNMNLKLLKIARKTDLFDASMLNIERQKNLNQFKNAATARASKHLYRNI